MTTIVNIQNASVYFAGEPKRYALAARKLMAKQFIFNNYISTDERDGRKRP